MGAVGKSERAEGVMVTMTCGGCGHQDDLDEFCRTPISGELPRGVYQCPACRLAFQRIIGPAEVLPWGGVIPGRVKLVKVQGVL